MSEIHRPCGDPDAYGGHGGPDDRHCLVCTDKTCVYNMPGIVYVNVNEEGVDYDSHSTVEAALAVHARFPNDKIEVRITSQAPGGTST